MADSVSRPPRVYVEGPRTNRTVEDTVVDYVVRESASAAGMGNDARVTAAIGAQNRLIARLLQVLYEDGRLRDTDADYLFQKDGLRFRKQ